MLFSAGHAVHCHSPAELLLAGWLAAASCCLALSNPSIHAPQHIALMHAYDADVCVVTPARCRLHVGWPHPACRQGPSTGTTTASVLLVLDAKGGPPICHET